MEIFFISLIAFLVAILTFFSGFGLGTILTPALLFFFPIEIAVSVTAIVHFVNNIAKISMLFKNVNWSIWLRFGLTAIIFAFIGAKVLLSLSHLPVLYTYTLSGDLKEVTLLKIVLGSLLILFALDEIKPLFTKLKQNSNSYYIGGVLSGFFGGLTGMQGALRAAFLIKAGLSKEAYIATGVAIAIVIDITRISVYSSDFSMMGVKDHIPLIVSASFSAIVGAILGRQLLRKISIRFIQYLVAILLTIISILLFLGIL